MIFVTLIQQSFGIINITFIVFVLKVCDHLSQTTVENFSQFWYNDANNIEKCSFGNINFDLLLNKVYVIDERNISIHIYDALTTMAPIDPCPHCGFDFDDGDVFQKLRSMSVYKDKNDTDVELIALYYGWTPQNKKRFSKKVIVQPFDGAQYTMCPECKVIFE
jgi:hypothetical protein